MSSGFRSFHPITGYMYFLLMVVLSSMIKHPVYLSLLILGAIALNLTTDKGKSLKKPIKFYLLMSSIIILINPIFNLRGSTILFYLGDKGITLEATVYGILVSVGLLSMLIFFIAFNNIMTSEKFLFVFGKISPKSAFVVTVAVRFVPLFIRRLKMVIEVDNQMNQKEDLRKRDKIKNAMENVTTLLGWSLEDGIKSAQSMRCREYGKHKRSSYSRYKFQARDILLLASMLMLFTLFFAGFDQGIGQYQIYPSLEGITVNLVHLIIFTLLVYIPVLIDIKEIFTWKYLRSKITVSDMAKLEKIY